MSVGDREFLGLKIPAQSSMLCLYQIKQQECLSLNGSENSHLENQTILTWQWTCLDSFGQILNESKACDIFFLCFGRHLVVIRDHYVLRDHSWKLQETTCEG